MHFLYTLSPPIKIPEEPKSGTNCGWKTWGVRALGVLTFLSYAVTKGFRSSAMLLILIPLVLLMLAIVSLNKPRSLLYYLVVIDGLMLAKALFGIAAARF